MRRISDTAAFCIKPSATLREALDRINRLGHACQIAVDDAGRVVGVLTDGDIRRAFLSERGLDDLITDCMNASPVLIKQNEMGKAEQLLRRVPFVPVVDEDGKLTDIIQPSHDVEGIDVAVVLAGGTGKRLRPLTESTPKPLLSVGGRPILDRILERLELAGVGTIFLSVNYLSQEIKSFVSRRENQSEISYLAESEPLGTAGPLSLLPETIDGNVLILNGDVLTNVSIEAMTEFHLRHGNDATVGAVNYGATVPFGVIRHNFGDFEGIDEKPHVSYLVAAGIYLLNTKVARMTPHDKRIDMPELLRSAREKGHRIGVFPIHEYWTDVGRHADLEAADRYHAPDQE